MAPMADATRLSSLILLVVLVAGCAAAPIGGPTAPRGATGAGTLTLPTGRSYPVFPEALAYTGKATYHWPDGRTYQGTFVSGQPEGIGAGTWPGGDRYHGTWHAGMKHGHGELARADGSHYVGDFVEGQRSGHGVEESAEGLYRGAWAHDLPNGEGQFDGTDGATYIGQWVDGRREGQGTYTDARGSTYTGGWYDDVPDGFGELNNRDGSGYAGQWRNGRQQGYGRSVSSADVTYAGTFVDGRREGYGIVERPDGSRYEGEWVAGRREGRGRESFADGSYHDGAWVADRPVGPGTRRDRTGIEIRGEWQGDVVTAGSLRLPTGAVYEGPLLTRRNTEVTPELLAWLEAEAAAEDPYAHFFLGTAYTDFADPAPDPFRATRHFRIAARAGIPDGQFRLALLLMADTPRQAMVWLNRAADAGQAQANTLLGDYYLAGTHVPRDEARAIGYLEAGSRAGDMAARNDLARVLATTSRADLRDGPRALALIRPLALMRGDWQHLDTLAAAYAAVSRFDDATDAQSRAIEDARRTLSPESPELTAMLERLDRYRSREMPTAGDS